MFQDRAKYKTSGSQEVKVIHLYHITIHLYDYKVSRTSGQDGDIGKQGLPPHTTTSKLQLKYRTSLITVRNQVEWKSNNYRTKETTSIPTGRQGRDNEMGG